MLAPGAAVSDADLLDQRRQKGQSEKRNGSGLSRFYERKLWQGELASLCPRVSYYAQLTDGFGRGTVTRGYREALAELPVDLHCIDTTPAFDSDQPAKIASPGTRPDIIILHHNPDVLNDLLALAPGIMLDGAYVIGIWEWGMASLPAEWREAFAAVDEVWVPSQFCAQAVLASAPAGLPVRVIPPVVTVPSPPVPADGRLATRRDLGIPADAFVFLCCCDASRSILQTNVEAVLSAFGEAFSGNPNAFLVVKINRAGKNPEAVRNLRRAYAASNVMFIDLAMDETRWDALCWAVDSIVSAHRAEAFGLEIARMMARGKPAIVTDWSGSANFCNAETAIMIPAGRTEVTSAENSYGVGAVWAEPCHSELVAALARMAKSPDLAVRLGAAGRLAIAKRLSLAVVARQIGTIIADLVARRKDVAGALAEAWEMRRRIAWRSPLALSMVRSGIADADQEPVISVIISVHDTSADLLMASVVSVLTQTWPHWELCICDDGSASPATVACIDRLMARDQRIRIRRLDRGKGCTQPGNAATDMASGSYVAFLGSGDTLAPDAMESYATTIREHPDCDMLYCDEDSIDAEGRYIDHIFKPDWSPDHLESCMYLRHMLVIRKAVFLALGGYRSAFHGAQDYDLALRIAMLDGQIVHIPRLLYHSRVAGQAAGEGETEPPAVAAAQAALADYAAKRYGVDARVDAGIAAGLFRIRRGEISQPPVSLLILTNSVTRDVAARGSINLANNFLDSIRDRTEYSNYRIVMISDGELTPRCRDTLRDCGGSEIMYQKPGFDFNFADKANFAVKAAQTELIVLLNDDMEVRNAGWLGALVDQLAKAEVGAVGAHLSYPDGRIQHVGMVAGIDGTTAHIYRGHPGDTRGYDDYAAVVRNWSMVTGACLATRKSLYERVGGLDTAFAADFNDSDYCLKLRQLGYRIVYTPHARLYHFENQTFQRTSFKPEERSLFLERWAAVVGNDPYYNPNLSRSSLTFEAAAGCELMASALANRAVAGTDGARCN